MFKNKILPILFAVLLICGAMTPVYAETFTLNSITITDWNDSDGLGLDILTDNSAYVPYATSPDLTVGESWKFNLFDIWTNEEQVAFGDDTIERPITVEFDWSMTASTGGPITGITKGFTEEGTVDYFYYQLSDWINDEGQVFWDFSSTNFTFGNDGRFSIALSEPKFNQGLLDPLDGLLAIDGQWATLYGGQINGAIVEATLLYVEAPTAVPIPPAIILLGTSLLGIAGIRRKYKK